MFRTTKGLILVVDDDEAIRTLTAEVLRSAGYVLVLAASGYEALAAMADSCFGLVLMDIDMPVMSGIEATAHIRADDDETMAWTPIIACSSELIEDRHSFCMCFGFNDFVSKQDGPDATLKAVDEFFASKPTTTFSESKAST